MAGSVRSHAKTYIPVGRRQDNPCLPCLAPPVHFTISMARAKCGALSRREGERACVLISITSWHGVSNLEEGLPVFP